MNLQALYSTRTHKDDARLEALNMLVMFFGFIVFPFALYLVLLNMGLVLAICIAYDLAFVDIALTTYGLRQGYKEQNFYRYFLNRLGDLRGLVFAITINLIGRGIIISFLCPNISFILLFASVSAVAPAWNALNLLAFHNDTVLQMPTIFNVEATGNMVLDTGEKTRLESYKMENDEEY